MSKTPKSNPTNQEDFLTAFFLELPSTKGTDDTFEAWRKANAKGLELFEEQPEKTRTFFFALASYWLARYSKGWDDAIETMKMQSEMIKEMAAELPKAVNRARLETIMANWDAIQAKQKRLITLHTKARPEAIKKRREKAEKNNAGLDKAISDLFAGPDSKGWRMTNDDIADFLEPYFEGMYKRSTILQRVKMLAANHRNKGRKTR